MSTKIHELKTWPPYFGAVISGAKRFEVRKDDRGFSNGDYVRLDEWDPKTQQYTGARALYRISYILHGGTFGIEVGHCVLGLSEP